MAKAQFKADEGQGSTVTLTTNRFGFATHLSIHGGNQPNWTSQLDCGRSPATLDGRPRKFGRTLRAAEMGPKAGFAGRASADLHIADARPRRLAGSPRP